MKVEYINPFIESIHNLFSTMLNCSPKSRDIGLSKLENGAREITGLIDLSGPLSGSVALSFPEETAAAMTGRLLGITAQAIDDDVVDAVGEFVNIIAGSAKAALCDENGNPVSIGLPRTNQNADHNVDAISKSVWLNVPFTSELGPFSLRVTVEPAKP